MQEMDYKLSVTVYSLVWYLLTHSYDNLCKYSTCTCIVNLRGKWWVLAAFKDLSTMVKLLKEWGPSACTCTIYYTYITGIFRTLKFNCPVEFNSP